MNAHIVRLQRVASRARRRLASFDPRFALAAIVCLGVALRLSEVARRDLWADEAYSVQIAKSGFSEIVDKAAADTHPPLYYLVLHYWISLFGDSEFAVRALSIVIGALTILLVYEVGKLLMNARAAILAALLVALSAFHLNYSIETRMYAMLALLTTASWYFFIALSQRPSRRASLGYVAASSALLYTHIYGLFIVIAQNAFVLISLGLARAPLERWKSVYKRWAPLQLVLIVAFSPWMFIAIRELETERAGADAAKLDPDVFPRPPVGWLLDTFVRYAGGRAGLALVCLLCLLAVAVGHYLRPAEPELRVGRLKSERLPGDLAGSAPILLLSVWLATPLAVAFTVSHLVTPIYYFRQTIGASVAFFLLVAVLLARAPSLKLFALGACALALSAGYYLYRYQPFNTQGWSSVSALVDQHAHTGDVVVFDSEPARDAFNYYSEQETRLTELVVRRTTSHGIRELAFTAQHHPRVWLVTAHGLTIGERLRWELGRLDDEMYHLGPAPPFSGLDLTFYHQHA
jgi:mannosyltransferase